MQVLQYHTCYTYNLLFKRKVKMKRHCSKNLFIYMFMHYMYNILIHFSMWTKGCLLLWDAKNSDKRSNRFRSGPVISHAFDKLNTGRLISSKKHVNFHSVAPLLFHSLWNGVESPRVIGTACQQQLYSQHSQKGMLTSL